jgi:hypothetical protein
LKAGDGMEACSLGMRSDKPYLSKAPAPSTPLVPPVTTLTIFKCPGGFKASESNYLEDYYLLYYGNFFSAITSI